MDNKNSKVSGVLICFLIALMASFLASLSVGDFRLELVGVPVFAMVVGMIATILMPSLSQDKRFKPGITFSSKKILQYAVIILGFSLNLSLILKVGSRSLPIIISTILTSLLVAFVMMKLLKIDHKTAILVGVGSSICGGSAVAATAPVVDASDEEIAQAISVIFIFNVLAAIIFPVLGYKIGLGTEGFAIFAGTAVNDTSSVTAAAAAAESIYHAEGILSGAVTVKLTRTLAIIPITLVLAVIQARSAKASGVLGSSVSLRQIFPWFILYFLAASIVTSLVSLMPEGPFSGFYQREFVGATKWISKFFIAMAMGAIGLNTNLLSLIKKGGKPILLGLFCWLSIIAVSLLMQLSTGLFYSNL